MSGTLHATVLGTGVWGPGLTGMAAARRMFLEPDPAPPPEPELPQAPMLPATERRRATPSTRLALAVAAEAIDAAGLDPAGLPAVFATSAGNPEIVNAMCVAMAERDYAVSPTRFHNSVHNAASGYFGIGASNRRAVTSLAAGDSGAGVGLLESLVQVATDSEPVLLVCVDVGYPFPLSEVRPMVGQWAVALVLAPTDLGPGRARIAARLAPEPGPNPALGHPALETSCAANPSARMLPLLMRIATGRGGPVWLPAGVAGHLRVDVEPTR